MGRRITITGLLALLSLGMTGAVPIDLCVEPSFEAAVAVVQLGEHSAAVRLRPVRPERCDVGDGYRARLMQRGPGVALVLATPAGERLERDVPWLDRADDGIVTLARRGRLGGLAVLLDGLIIEDRALRAATASPPIAAEPPVAPAPVPPPVAVEPTPPPTPPPPAPPPMILARAAGNGEPPGPARTVGMRAREASSSSRRARPAALVVDRDAASADAALLARPPPPPEAAPFADAPVRVADVRRPAPAAPRPLAASTGAPADPVQPAAPPGTTWRPRIGTRVGGAMRSPSVLGLEVALALDLHGAAAEIGALPPVEWPLEDRPLEIGAAWVGVGWTPRLWRGASVHLDGRLMAVLERWTVLRLGIDDAVTRALWDAGGEIGLAVASPVGDGWRVGAMLAGRWMATANDVLIPDGPRAALNTWQMRLGFAIDWRP